MVIRGEYENKQIKFKEAVSFRLTQEFFHGLLKMVLKMIMYSIFCGAFAF